MLMPGISASPRARILAFVWSSASRCTLWSSAYSPAAAMIPACRIAPPKRCLYRRASLISARSPARSAPTGHPSPLVRQRVTVSNPRACSWAGTPEATAAFISRAPSMWVRSLCRRATSTTARSRSSGHTVPPPRFAVCSTDTSRAGG